MRPEPCSRWLAAAWPSRRPPARRQEGAKPARDLSEAGRSNVMLAQAYLEAGACEPPRTARAVLASDGDSRSRTRPWRWCGARRSRRQGQGEFKRALALAPADGAVLNAYGSWLCGRATARCRRRIPQALQDAQLHHAHPAAGERGQCAMHARDWSPAEGYLRRA
jgi:Tfp pilus assembly protein PilF